MDRASFMFKLRDEKIDVYKQIHKNVWDELQEAFKNAGRHNYSIWYAGGFIFGYYEADDIKKCREILMENDIVKRWGKYMEGFNLVDEHYPPASNKSGFYDMEMVFYME